MSQTLSTPRLRRREARIQSILDTSMDIMKHEGLNGLTIKRLAERLDYTPGAFYRYFASKDEILVELQNRTLRDLLAQYQSLWDRCTKVASAQGASAEVIALMTLTATRVFYQRLPETMPTSFGLIHLAVGEPGQFLGDNTVASVAQHMMELLTAVASQFDVAKETGALSNGSSIERAVTLWSALHGTMLMNKFSRFELELFNALTLGSQLSDTLFSGWGASPELLNDATTLVATLDANQGLDPIELGDNQP